MLNTAIVLTEPEDPIRIVTTSKLSTFISCVDRSHHDTSIAGDTWPELCCLLADWSCDGGSLHFSFGIDNLVCLLVFTQSRPELFISSVTEVPSLL